MHIVDGFHDFLKHNRISLHDALVFASRAGGRHVCQNAVAEALLLEIIDGVVEAQKSIVSVKLGQSLA
jgi:hypothetical protein